MFSLNTSRCSRPLWSSSACLLSMPSFLSSGNLLKITGSEKVAGKQHQGEWRRGEGKSWLVEQEGSDQASQTEETHCIISQSHHLVHCSIDPVMWRKCKVEVWLAKYEGSVNLYGMHPCGHQPWSLLPSLPPSPFLSLVSEGLYVHSHKVIGLYYWVWN